MKEIQLDNIIDAHSHLHLLEDSVLDGIFKKYENKYFYVLLNCIRLDEQELVRMKQVKDKYETDTHIIKIGVGVHPMEAHKCTSKEVIAFLEKAVKNYKIDFIGEIGLDYREKVLLPEEEGAEIVLEERRNHQVEIFKAQMDFANENRLGVNLHLVNRKPGFWDLIQSCLEAYKYIKFYIFHTFSGSYETFKSMINSAAISKNEKKLYWSVCHFSYECKRNILALKKYNCIDQILIETDVDSPDEIASVEAYEECVYKVYEVLTEAMALPAAIIEEKTKQNMKRLFLDR